jgi:CBS domain-containing protein
MSANIYEEPITNYISRGVASVQVTDPISVAIDRYKSSPYQVVLVTNPDGALTGLITDNDLTKLLGMDPKDPVDRIATTSDVVAINESAQLWQLLKIMNGENPRQTRFDVIPVVDSNKRPVGVVTRDNLHTVLPGALAAAR